MCNIKYAFINKFLFLFIWSSFHLTTATDQIGISIPEEIWMSKQGATHELLVPIVSDEAEISAGPFRYNKYTRMRLRSNGCSCQSLICGCCMDINISQFNYQRTGCMNLTADPKQFEIVFSMLWDGEPIFQNALSGRNPPAMCVPLPVPYIPNLDACIRIFDISILTDKRRAYACLDMDARIQRAPILVLHFDCMQVGSDATFALIKPTTATFLIKKRP